MDSVGVIIIASIHHMKFLHLDESGIIILYVGTYIIRVRFFSERVRNFVFGFFKMAKI